MTRTKMLFGTALVVIAIILYGNLDEPPEDSKTEPDNERQIAFEVTAHPPTGRQSAVVGIVAQLGSAGNYEKANARIYDDTTDETRVFRHVFKAKAGDMLSATVTSTEGALYDLHCYFHQRGYKGLPNTVPNANGWGDISAPVIDGGQPREIARCTAIVR